MSSVTIKRAYKPKFETPESKSGKILTMRKAYGNSLDSENQKTTPRKSSMSSNNSSNSSLTERRRSESFQKKSRISEVQTDATSLIFYPPPAAPTDTYLYPRPWVPADTLPTDQMGRMSFTNFSQSQDDYSNHGGPSSSRRSQSTSSENVYGSLSRNFPGYTGPPLPSQNDYNAGLADSNMGMRQSYSCPQQLVRKSSISTASYDSDIDSLTDMTGPPSTGGGMAGPYQNHYQHTQQQMDNRPNDIDTRKSSTPKAASYGNPSQVPYNYMKGDPSASRPAHYNSDNSSDSGSADHQWKPSTYSPPASGSGGQQQQPQPPYQQLYHQRQQHQSYQQQVNQQQIYQRPPQQQPLLQSPNYGQTAQHRTGSQPLYGQQLSQQSPMQQQQQQQQRFRPVNQQPHQLQQPLYGQREKQEELARSGTLQGQSTTSLPMDDVLMSPPPPAAYRDPQPPAAPAVSAQTNSASNTTPTPTDYGTEVNQVVDCGKKYTVTSFTLPPVSSPATSSHSSASSSTTSTLEAKVTSNQSARSPFAAQPGPVSFIVGGSPKVPSSPFINNPQTTPVFTTAAPTAASMFDSRPFTHATENSVSPDSVPITPPPPAGFNTSDPEDAKDISDGAPEPSLYGPKTAPNVFFATNRRLSYDNAPLSSQPPVQLSGTGLYAELAAHRSPQLGQTSPSGVSDSAASSSCESGAYSPDFSSLDRMDRMDGGASVFDSRPEPPSPYTKLGSLTAANNNLYSSPPKSSMTRSSSKKKVSFNL